MAEKTKTVEKLLSNGKNHILIKVEEKNVEGKNIEAKTSDEISVLKFENSEELFNITLEPNETLSNVKKMIEDQRSIKFDVVTEKGVTIMGNKKISEMNGKIYIKNIVKNT